MSRLRWRRKRTLARAEKALRHHPAPETYHHLAGELVRADLPDRALAVLAEGRRAFPDADDLAAFHDELAWSRLRQRARDIQARIDADPQAADVVALAHVFTEAGDVGRAIDALRRGLDQFPEDLPLNLEMARLRRRVWQRDLLAADGLAAVEHLSCVLVLQEGHVAARTALIEIYIQVGAFEEALTHLEWLAAAGVDLEDDALRGHLERCTALARDCRASQTEHDLEALLDAVEAARQPIVNLDDLAGPPPGTVEPHAQGERVRDGLLRQMEALAREPAVRAVLLRDRTNRPRTVELVGRDADPTVEAVLAEVAASAAQACERMDIGRLQAATIQSPAGTVSVLAFRDEVLACLCDHRWRPGQVEDRLAELARRVRDDEGTAPCSES